MLKNFSFQEGVVKSLNKSDTKHFLYFFSAMLGSYAGIAITLRIWWPDLKFYCAQYVVLTFIIHAQSYQILAYSKLIRFQLKEFNNIVIEQLELKGQESLRKKLLKIFEFVEKVNKTFSPSLLIIMAYFYMSVLSNFHWLSMSLFEFAHLSGKYIHICNIFNKKHSTDWSRSDFLWISERHHHPFVWIHQL